MTTVSFPSADFPAFPSVTMDCPDGWSPLPAPAVQLAVAKDVVPGEFRPNVVVVISRLQAGQTLEAAVAEAAARLEPLPGYAEIGREEREISGFKGFRLEAAWRDERVGTVTQAVRLAVVEQGPVADLVQITGTCAGTQARELWGQVRAVQDSVAISV